MGTCENFGPKRASSEMIENLMHNDYDKQLLSLGVSPVIGLR